jgi:cystathionine beta-lyase/cystathionine gamma-synthase
MKGKPVIPPVYMTATYQFKHSDDLIDVVQEREGFIYSRWNNPSVMEAEQALAALEGYDCSLGFSSGMAAISTTLLAFLQSGSRVVSTREIYGGTYELLNYVLSNLGIQTTFAHCWDQDRLLEEIETKPDILYLESPTNPLLRLVDIAPLAKAARQHGTLVILDSTFASPINQQPKELGVDIVIHSATKYLGGHHDVTAGMVCCDSAHYDPIWTRRKILGGVMDPMSAFLTLRGVQTLELRIQKQNQNALEIARFLDQHAKVARVNYPGLTNHPDHSLALRQMKGFGGMLSFEIQGYFEDTKAFMDRLQAIKLATSLGGVTSLATQPITNTHAGLSPEDRSKAGVSESLVRLSVGVEPVERLLDDLELALKGV